MHSAIIPKNFDGQPAVATHRVRIDCAYDGSLFNGWAAQPGLVTVQGVLEEALELILRAPHRVTVAGRTDAGVHAEAQTVHCDLTDTDWRRLQGRNGDDDPARALSRRLRGALQRCLYTAEERMGLPKNVRGILQGAIQIHSVEEVSFDFDARFSATGRRYVYRIADGAVEGVNPLHRSYTWAIPERLDCTHLNEVATQLLGLRDFLSFCKPREGATTIRELRELSLTRTENGIIEVRVIADAFCHHMVRSLVGALVLYGTGKRDATWLTERIENPGREASLTLAPPHALALAEIYYPASELYGAQAERARSRREESELP